MIRRFNYTNRVKISRNRVEIALFKDNDGKYFRAKLDLSGYKFPGNAKIYIEPNYKSVYQRFDFGTVGEFKEPASTHLNELPETELIYFDVSVVDESQEVGLLLGKARGISISMNDQPNDRIPLLYVNPTDLGDQIWKITFESSEDGRPVLEINSRIPHISEKARNDINFICLVYPAVFRVILTKIALDNETEFEEEHWKSQWLKFLDVVLSIKPFPVAEEESDNLTPEQDAWVDQCVNEYCKKLKLFEKFTSL